MSITSSLITDGQVGWNPRKSGKPLKNFFSPYLCMDFLRKLITRLGCPWAIDDKLNSGKEYIVDFLEPACWSELNREAQVKGGVGGWGKTNGNRGIYARLKPEFSRRMRIKLSKSRLSPTIVVGWADIPKWIPAAVWCKLARFQA